MIVESPTSHYFIFHKPVDTPLSSLVLWLSGGITRNSRNFDSENVCLCGVVYTRYRYKNVHNNRLYTGKSKFSLLHIHELVDTSLESLGPGLSSGITRNSRKFDRGNVWLTPRGTYLCAYRYNM